jgi:hypothetical protein
MISRARLGGFLAAVTTALAAAGCTGSPHRDWYIAAGTYAATTNAVADAAEAGVISPERVRDDVLPAAERGKAALDAAYLLLPPREGDPVPAGDSTAFTRHLQTVRSSLHIVRAILTAGENG